VSHVKVRFRQRKYAINIYTSLTNQYISQGTLSISWYIHILDESHSHFQQLLCVNLQRDLQWQRKIWMLSILRIGRWGQPVIDTRSVADSWPTAINEAQSDNHDFSDLTSMWSFQSWERPQNKLGSCILSTGRIIGWPRCSEPIKKKLYLIEIPVEGLHGALKSWQQSIVTFKLEEKYRWKW